jgi:hypothetical protein
MFILCLIGFLTGCGPQIPQFIVYRDVPESPSFVVIPANDYMHEVFFANEIEEAIISCGVKVVKRPTTKRIRTEKSIGGLEGNQTRDSDASVTTVREADAKRVESYWEYESIEADYLVETYVSEKHVKNLKSGMREVLTVLYANDYVKPGKRLPWRYKVYDTLKHMGIQVQSPSPRYPSALPLMRLLYETPIVIHH